MYDVLTEVGGWPPHPRAAADVVGTDGFAAVTRHVSVIMYLLVLGQCNTARDRSNTGRLCGQRSLVRALRDAGSHAFRKSVATFSISQAGQWSRDAADQLGTVGRSTTTDAIRSQRNVPAV